MPNMTETQRAEAKVALTEVLAIVNNDAEVARFCGVKPQAVTGWINRGIAPPEHTGSLFRLALERGRTVAMWRLRPDVFEPWMFSSSTRDALKAAA